MKGKQYAELIERFYRDLARPLFDESYQGPPWEGGKTKQGTITMLHEIAQRTGVPLPLEVAAEIFADRFAKGAYRQAQTIGQICDGDLYQHQGVKQKMAKEMAEALLRGNQKTVTKLREAFPDLPVQSQDEIYLRAFDQVVRNQQKYITENMNQATERMNLGEQVRRRNRRPTAVDVQSVADNIYEETGEPMGRVALERFLEIDTVDHLWRCKQPFPAQEKPIFELTEDLCAKLRGPAWIFGWRSDSKIRWYDDNKYLPRRTAFDLLDRLTGLYSSEHSLHFQQDALRERFWNAFLRLYEKSKYKLSKRVISKAVKEANPWRSGMPLEIAHKILEWDCNDYRRFYCELFKKGRGDSAVEVLRFASRKGLQFKPPRIQSTDNVLKLPTANLSRILRANPKAINAEQARALYEYREPCRDELHPGDILSVLRAGRFKNIITQEDLDAKVDLLRKRYQEEPAKYKYPSGIDHISRAWKYVADFCGLEWKLQLETAKP